MAKPTPAAQDTKIGRPAPGAGRWIPWLLVAAVVIAFGRVVTDDFSAIDDADTISFNPRLNPPTFGREGVLWYWGHEELDLYIPVTYTVWALLAKACWVPTPDEHGWHLDPHVFHAASLLLHALSVLLVYALLRRLLRCRGACWAAAAGALLFGLHPIQVEAVAWTSGMKDLLYAMFSLTALLLYVRAIDTPGRTSDDADDSNGVAMTSGRAAYWLGLVGLVLALLSKPTAMVTPVLAAVIDRMILGRKWRQVLRSLWPWVAVVVPLAVVAKLAQTGAGIDAGPLWQRPIVAGASLAFYLGKLLVPARFAFDYGWQPPLMLQKPWFWAIAAIPATLAVILWVRRRRWPWLAAAGLVSVAALLPVLGFVPFSYQYFTTVADHYVYLAMLGPAMALAWLLGRLPGRAFGAAAVAVGLLLAVLAAITIHELGYWRDDETSIRRVLAIMPDSILGHNGLGKVYQRRGDLPRAEAEFKRALAVRPKFVVPWQNLVTVYAAEERADDAIAALDAMVEIFHTLPPPYRDQDQSNQLLELAVKAIQEHRFADSVRYLEAFLRYHPENGDARQLLAKARDAVRKVATQPASSRPTPSTRSIPSTPGGAIR